MRVMAGILFFLFSLKSYAGVGCSAGCVSSYSKWGLEYSEGGGAVRSIEIRIYQGGTVVHGFGETADRAWANLNKECAKIAGDSGELFKKVYTASAPRDACTECEYITARSIVADVINSCKRL